MGIVGWRMRKVNLVNRGLNLDERNCLFKKGPGALNQVGIDTPNVDRRVKLNRH